MMPTVVGTYGRQRPLRRIAPIMFALLALAGCFAPRTHLDSLNGKELPAAATAIMPVTPGEIIIEPYVSYTQADAGQTSTYLRSIAKEYAAAVDIVNDVLDSLAGGAGSPLRGPARLRSTYGGDLALYAERFNVYVDDPGPLDETWKKTGLAELAGKLGINRVVRVKIVIKGKTVQTAGGTAALFGGWDGESVSTVELWSLVPARRIATGSGSAQFWGRVGLVGGGAAAAPFAVGTTFGRAVSKSVRDALARLFTSENAQKNGK
jgi:hypothetical protein